MREVKFRAWDKDEHKMIPFSHIWLELEDGYGGVKERTSETIPAEFRDVDDFELMQYIGLRDVDENDLYEHDIVRFTDLRTADEPEFVGVIDFSAGKFVIRSGYSSFDNWLSLRVKKIGNLYQDSELIQE